MNVEFINPFLEATVNVLKTMAMTESTAAKPFLKKEAVASGDISGIIGITGDTAGSLSITFTESCICDIVSNMFGETLTAIDEDIKDAVGEITNMISGDARRQLSEKGMVLHGAIPTVVSGSNHHVKHMGSGATIAIPFTTKAGNFTVEVCFNA